ncbi:UbiA family prenyltransferase [Nonomuraea rosea]|uniref:UbiA family prenyltransferase n=1 Tax=Nonomuraea rosea TaxID=638574 RepID=A0ABP6YRS9_9ACTN
MNIKDLAELVRAPAALTVPGDTLAGGASGLAPAAASICLYWAGMALNDYADRDLDAKERPERPIPSGRVRPWQALALASGLTAAGLALAARRRRLRIALPLAATIWAYDLKLKDTPAGPAAMAAARGLDVLLGGRPRAGLAAAAIAAHTYGVTALSRGEVNGGTRAQAITSITATAVAAALAASVPQGSPCEGGSRENPSVRTAARLAFVGAYVWLVGRAQAKAAMRPDPATVREAVGASILGILPLQAALTAERGTPVTVAMLAASHPLARRLARRVSPT